MLKVSERFLGVPLLLAAKDCVEIKFSGFNGNAEVETIDKSSDVSDKIGEQLFGNVDKNDVSKYGEYLKAISKVYTLTSSMKYSIASDSEKKSKFSNGDTIKLQLKYDEQSAAELGVEFTDTTFDYTVSGLVDGQVIDPFEGLKVEYEGVAPNAKAKFDTSGCTDYVKNNVSFSVDGDNGSLSNGEKLKATIYYDESKAEQNSIEFSQTSKEYTVNGVLQYPSNLNGVDLTAIDKQFKDMLDANALSKLSIGEEVRSDKLDTYIKITKVEPKIVLKAYLLQKNLSSYSNYKNEYDCLWEIKVTGTCTDKYSSEYKEGQTLSYTAYYMANIQNIPVNADNAIPSEYLVKYDDEYYSNEYSDYTYNKIYNDWITANKADYNITEMPVE